MKSKRKTTLYNKVETKTRTPHEHEYAYDDAYCNQAFPPNQTDERTTDPTRRTKEQESPYEPTWTRVKPRYRRGQTHHLARKMKKKRTPRRGRGGGKRKRVKRGRQTGFSGASPRAPPPSPPLRAEELGLNQSWESVSWGETNQTCKPGKWSASEYFSRPLSANSPYGFPPLFSPPVEKHP